MTAQEWLKFYAKFSPKVFPDYTNEAADIIRFLLTECQKWQEWHDCEYRERKKYRQDANHFAGEVQRLTAELAEVRTYKQVIDDALVVANIGVASGDARADLHKLLVWEVDVALDPRVSKRAAGLLAEKDAEIERGKTYKKAHSEECKMMFAEIER